jgi:hypothetical protein
VIVLAAVYQRCASEIARGRLPCSWMARAFLAAARRLHALWLKPLSLVRSQSSWSKWSSWPLSMGCPHRLQGVPYACGSRALRSFWNW